MLKVYTDQSYITPEHRRHIFPLLLDLCYKSNSNLIQEFQLCADLDEASIAILPAGLSYYFTNDNTKALYEFIDTALAAKKPVWVYSDTDFGITLDKEVVTFRLGGFHSKLNDKTFILPSFIQDPYQILGSDFYTLPKTPRPKIGFVGNADGSTTKYLKELLIHFEQLARKITGTRFNDRQPFYPSSIERFKMLSRLKADNRVVTDFSLHKKYRAGAITDADRNRTQHEFFKNIASNPYTFCLRGSGNFSVRFYETLAMGRIPLLIDTDNRLPLNKTINWEQHCVIATADNYIDKLISFHEMIDQAAFEQMQLRNRELWLTSLTREGFFMAISKMFTQSK